MEGLDKRARGTLYNLRTRLMFKMMIQSSN